MVFLTRTAIKGDAGGAQVVAHEFAHSWTGNLITNKTNEDFWLNEGFTTYAERRIIEVVQGEDRAALSIGMGWRGIPVDAFEPVSNIYSKIVLLANEFRLGRMPREDEVADWPGQEWELYLENLHKSAEA
uniref:Peptidase M1 membrane alanine aminopeptidase domain-containing protein n=1 Tax=Nelumbo nucifera TaxID=4432 RepID=A0A822ZSH1_NELNU|nr:TPA_asm: hypothetical protein HUJ06_003028 [Nelumbo nucifera]